MGFPAFLRANNRKKKLLILLAYLAGLFVVLMVVIEIITYVTQPHIQYSLKQADCSSAAIAARNATANYSSKSCVLILSAKNLQNQSVSVDYDGIGGGPFAGWHPMIRINAVSGTFCYASVNTASTDFGDFKPNERHDLTLRCASSSEKLPKNYDTSSDANPASIEILGDMFGGRPKVTIPVTPLR